jgi:hypothetical protein
MEEKFEEQQDQDENQDDGLLEQSEDKDGSFFLMEWMMTMPWLK